MDKPYPAPAQGNVNIGPGIIAATCVTVAISTIAILLRFGVRLRLTKSFWWDDWTILFALCGNIIGLGLDCVEVHYGYGRPQYYLDEWQIIEFKKYTYGQWIQTFATLMWTKISICLFLMRIPVSKALIWPLKIAIAFLAVSNIILTILWIDQCRPVDAAWNHNVDGKCFSRGQTQRIIIAQAIISAVSDFLFSCYPILILWKVKLHPRTKIALCCLMGLGVFTGACCIVRTVLNYQAIPTDATYGGVTNWFWRLFEVNIGLVAACAPALRPGYTWLLDRISGKSSVTEFSNFTDEARLHPVQVTKTIELATERSVDREVAMSKSEAYAAV